jgi:3-hydroxyisobutyrate dehydrogenase-like beta-hydroxyacid dehydrogenase
MTRIAFLGTGLLGSALAEAAAKRGDQVTVWNRTADKARALEQFGITVANTPADAVRGAKHVHLVLKDDAVVSDVIARLRPGLDEGAIILDHTTTLPALTAERVKALNADGVNYLHAPVFIGPAAARAGQGTILVAGPRKLFDAVKNDLERFAPKVEYAGERGDLAAVYKLSGNAFIIGINALVADVLTVSGSAGVSPEEAMRVIQFFDPSSVISGRGKNMIARSYAPSFELEMARKDVRLMIETAGGKPLSSLPGIAARMDTLIAEGRGAEDLAVMGKDAVA